MGKARKGSRYSCNQNLWQCRKLGNSMGVGRTTVFQDKPETPDWVREITRLESPATKMRRAIADMNEEARAQVSSIQVCNTEEGQRFTLFYGPRDLLASLNLTTAHVGKITAMLAAEAGKRAFMGPSLVPVDVNGWFPFMVRMNVEGCLGAPLHNTLCVRV